jgi:hypothetical protein
VLAPPPEPADQRRRTRANRTANALPQHRDAECEPVGWAVRSTKLKHNPLFAAEQRILAVDDLANPLHKSEPLRAGTLPNVPADEYASETYFESSLYSLHDIGTATT